MRYITSDQGELPGNQAENELLLQLASISDSVSSLASTKLNLTGGAMTGPLVTTIPRIVFDGDSLVAGTGALPFNMFPNGGDYPSQVVGALDPRGTYSNLGVGGETLATMLTNAPAAVDPLLTAGSNNIVVIAGGSNDIQAGTSPTTIYNTLTAYCKARRAAGWRVIVGTVGPRTDSGNGATFETNRLALNTLIRGNWPTIADGIADWGADPNIGLNAAQSTDLAYYAGDGAHLNWRGYAIRAGYALSALSTLGVIGSYKKNTAPQSGDLWLPAVSLHIVTGAPVLQLLTGTFHQAWKMPHGSDTAVGGSALVPTDWGTFDLCPVYTRASGAVTSGNFGLAVSVYAALNVFSFSFADIPAAGTTQNGYGAVGGASQALVQLPAVGQHVPAAGAVYAPGLIGSLSFNSTSPRIAQEPVIKRAGTDATDTCTDDMYLLGIYLLRLS